MYCVTMVTACVLEYEGRMYVYVNLAWRDQIVGCKDTSGGLPGTRRGRWKRIVDVRSSLCT